MIPPQRMKELQAEARKIQPSGLHGEELTELLAVYESRRSELEAVARMAALSARTNSTLYFDSHKIAAEVVTRYLEHRTPEPTK